MAAKSLGDLFFTLSLKSAGFAEQLAQASESVERVGKKMRGVANDLAGVGLGFAAGATGMVLAAANLDSQVAASVERLKGTFGALSVEMGRALLPAVETLRRSLGAAVVAWRSLSEETQGYLAKGVMVAAVVGTGLFALGKVASVGAAAAEGLGLLASGYASLVRFLLPVAPAANAAKAAAVAGLGGIPPITAAVEKGFLSMLPSIWATVAPLLGVAAVVAVVALAAGALYKAWTENLGGIQDKAKAAWEWLSNAARKVADSVVAYFNAWAKDTAQAFSEVARLGRAFVDALWRHFEQLKRLLIAWVKEQARTLSGLFEAFGVDTQPMLQRLDAAFNLVSTLASRDTLNAGLEAGKSFAVAVGEGVAGAASFALDGTGMMLRDMKDFALSGVKDIRAAVANLFGNGANVGLPGVVEVSTVGRGPSGPGGHNIMDFAAGRGSAQMQAFNKAVSRSSEDMGNAVTSIAERFVSSMGTAGTMLSNAIQAAATGGPMAALASIGVDLLMQSEGFKQTMAVVNGGLQVVADALGSLLTPLQPLLAALFGIINAGLAALAPVFDLVGKLIAPLVPPLVLLGSLLEALAPVLALAVQAFLLVMMPLQGLAGPVMHALFEVLKFVGITILTVVKAVGGVWNGLVEAVQDVLRTLGSISIFGKKPLGFLNGWANGLESAIINTDVLAAQIQALEGLTWDEAQAKAAATAEQLKNTQAVQKATEALTNVPSVWKVALARFNAMDPRSPAPAPSGGGTWAPPPNRGQWESRDGGPVSGGPAPSPAAPAQAPIVINQNNYGMDPDKTAAETRRAMEDAYLHHGRNRSTMGAP